MTPYPVLVGTTFIVLAAPRSFCHINMWRAVCCLSLTLGLTAPAALALDAGKDQPTQVQADRIEANQVTGVVTYSGRVHFARGGIDIHADNVEVHQKGDAVQSIRATGAPVRFRQRGPGARDEVRGSAARVDYSAAHREVTLTGQARFEQNNDVFEAATVRYRLDGSSTLAEGNDRERVQAQFHRRRPEAETPAP